MKVPFLIWWGRWLLLAQGALFAVSGFSVLAGDVR